MKWNESDRAERLLRVGHTSYMACGDNRIHWIPRARRVWSKVAGWVLPYDGCVALADGDVVGGPLHIHTPDGESCWDETQQSEKRRLQLPPGRFVSDLHRKARRGARATRANRSKGEKGRKKREWSGVVIDYRSKAVVGTDRCLKYFWDSAVSLLLYAPALRNALRVKGRRSPVGVTVREGGERETGFCSGSGKTNPHNTSAPSVFLARAASLRLFRHLTVKPASWLSRQQHHLRSL